MLKNCLGPLKKTVPCLARVPGIVFYCPGVLKVTLLTCGIIHPGSVSALGFPDSSVGKESTCNAGDPASIPGLGRSAGEGKGYLLQYSGLENSTDCTVHGVSKSQTRLSDFDFHFSVSALMSPQRSNKSRITLNPPLLLPKLLGLLLNVEVEDRPMKGSLPQEMRWDCSRGAAGTFCLHCLSCRGLSLTGYGEEKKQRTLHLSGTAACKTTREPGMATTQSFVKLFVLNCIPFLPQAVKAQLKQTGSGSGEHSGDYSMLG